MTVCQTVALNICDDVPGTCTITLKNRSQDSKTIQTNYELARTDASIVLPPTNNKQEEAEFNLHNRNFRNKLVTKPRTMFTTKNSKRSTIPPQSHEGEPATITSILRKSKEAENIIGPDIQYEGNRPSQIRSSSYRSDIRHNGESHLLEESTQLKIVSTREEENGLRRVLPKASTGSRLLAAFLGKKQEHDDDGNDDDDDDDEADYSNILVPKLSPGDRKKHRDFFSQLDDIDDDASVPASDRTYDTIHSNENHETIKASRSDATVQDILEDHQVESFSTFLLQRMNCGCMSTDIDMSEDKEKAVTINPVAVVYNIHSTGTASLLDK